MTRSRWILIVSLVVSLTACGPTMHRRAAEGAELGKALGLDSRDTSSVVLIVNASMCFSCDASLAPFLDVLRRHDGGVAIWLWEEPTRQERGRLAAERIQIAGVVPSDFRGRRRDPLVVWGSSGGTLRSGSALEAIAVKGRR